LSWQSQNNSKAWKRHQEELDAMRLAAVKHREELCRKHDKYVHKGSYLHSICHIISSPW
jgi:hypothetical protein